MSWTDRLQQASFRGIPFGVLAADTAVGRRTALHEYPYRDKPWIEDIGRSTRKITFRGFLVSDSKVYGGGDVIGQRDRFIGAAESPGAGTLVHPTLGRLTVNVSSCRIEEKFDEGNYFEVGLELLESGERIFPTVSGATGALTGISALGLDSAASADFLTRAVADLKLGASVVNQVVSTATKWAKPALSLVRDATNLSSLASNLPGVLGRYFGGANVGGLGLLGSTGEQLVDASTSVADLIKAGTEARTLVQTSIDTFLTLAGGNKPAEFAASSQALAAAVLGSCVNPADGVRLLARLAVSPTPDPTTTSPVGLAMADIQTGCNDLFRRAAAAALARASSTYQPSSYDDAVRVRGLVVDVLDAEIAAAGDQGEDRSFSALRTLRQSVVDDITERGATLAPIKTFKLPSALPSLYLANRLYRDPTRATQIELQSKTKHPLFCPPKFRALAK
ncbi:MAG: DNA circularization N-terminal domain-containing protein [Alphaproteobacteria bacterium]|nr:DNA circularization N-terminal domain-containing protein [Alphaproteobacteria bacterium]